MSDPLKLSRQQLLDITHLLAAGTGESAYQLFYQFHTFIDAHADEEAFYLVTEQDTMRAQIAVKAMHDTLDLEHRLAQNEHRIFQLEARNQQNSERIAYLQQQLEQMRKKEE